MTRLRPPGRLPVALAVAGLVLAVASRGEVTVLGLLLVALVPRPATLVAVAGALTASSWRWGATSLEALAGAQAVLGPAGGVGPATAALGSWLAAAAILLAVARRRDPWSAATVGAVVAALVAGPAPGGELPVRAFVAIGAGVAALGLGRWRGGRRSDGLLAWGGAGAGAAAVVAVGADAPPWPPAAELEALVEGAALAGAVVAIVLVGSAVVDRLRPTAARRPGPPRPDAPAGRDRSPGGAPRWRPAGAARIVARPGAGVPARGTAPPR